MTHNLIIIQVSFPVDFELQPLAYQLIKEKLAICIHEFSTITSFYEWNNAMEQSNEKLVHIKAKKHHFTTIESIITDVHPYDIPEIITIPMGLISQPYLEWTNKI
jgi:periplasmic divalent cation tolerance protein